MIRWHMKILSVGGGVLAGTEVSCSYAGPVSSNTSAWLDPENMMQTGVCMLSYQHSIMVVTLCFSMQKVVTTGFLETL